jgi:type IV pilus assembly protein PilA
VSLRSRSPRRGFTLIELMIVVVIIGILASIALPKFGTTKDRVFLTSVKTDLRNLASAEEAYFAENRVYTSSVSGFVPSPNISIIISNADANGWSATGTNASMSTTVTCTIRVGATANSTYLDGLVKCT